MNVNTDWNPHYDIKSPRNIEEIEKREKYAQAFQAIYVDQKDDKAAEEFLLSCERTELGGRDGYDFGVIVKKDWGSNEVISYHHENGIDVCVKKICVKPDHMLSLQSHMGRKEEWLVTDGILTLISDGRLYEVSDAGVFDITRERNEINDSPIAKKEDGHWSIILPKGSIHCMINRADKPVTVIETQTGITKEADNNRYIDQIRDQKEARATIPLSSELHYKSARLYWMIEADIAARHPTWRVGYKVE